ncbi:MAG: cysteine--tRNA ligase, partial [Neisseriaceae bacterium]
MKFYNTLTKKKEEFEPIEKNKIKMYVCGQTTYDFCHLGHARKEIVFDMIRRWFITSGYEVLYVENITDIDDKIINRARENNESINEL